jgi:hypothetical protein
MSARLGGAFLLDLASVLAFLGTALVGPGVDAELALLAVALAVAGNALGWRATRGRDVATGFGAGAVCAALVAPCVVGGAFALLLLALPAAGIAQGCTWIWIARAPSAGTRSRLLPLAAAWLFLVAPVVLFDGRCMCAAGSAHLDGVYDLCVTGLSGLALYAALRGRGTMGVIMLIPLGVMAVLDVAGGTAVSVAVVLASAAAAVWACAQLRTLASPLAALLAGLLGGALAAVPVDARALPFAVEILTPLAAALAWLAAARLAPSRRVLDGVAITAGIALAALPVGGDHDAWSWPAIALRALYLLALALRIGSARPTAVPTMTARA